MEIVQREEERSPRATRRSPQAPHHFEFAPMIIKPSDPTTAKKPPASLLELLRRNPRNVEDIKEYLQSIMRGQLFRSHLLPDLIRLAEADNWSDFKLAIDIVGKAHMISGGTDVFGFLYALNLSSCGLKSSYLSDLFKILRKPFRVEYLNIQTSAVKFLLQLDLSNNNLMPTSRGGRQLYPSVVQRIVKWLIHPDCQLEALNLADNPQLGGSSELSEGEYLGHFGYGSDVYRLFTALTLNQSLQVLNVANTGVNVIDFKFLAKSLTDNNALRVVDLSKNPTLTFAGREALKKLLTTRYKKNRQPIRLELAQTGLMIPVITGDKPNPIRKFASEIHLQLSAFQLRCLGDQLFAPYEPDKKVPRKWTYYLKLISIFVFIAGGVLAIASPIGELIGVITAAAGLTMGAAGIGHHVVEFIKHITSLSTVLGPKLDELLSVENIELVYEVVKETYEFTSKAKKKIAHLKHLRDSLNSSVEAHALIEKLHSHYQVMAKLFLEHPHLQDKMKTHMVHRYHEVISRLSPEEAIRFGQELGLPIRVCLLSAVLSTSEDLEQLIASFFLRIQLTPFDIFRTVTFKSEVHHNNVISDNDCVLIEANSLEFRGESCQWAESGSKEVWMLDLLQRSGVVARTAKHPQVQFDLRKKLRSADGKVWTRTDYMNFGCQQADNQLLECVNAMVAYYYHYIYQRRQQQRVPSQPGDLRKLLAPSYSVIYDHKTYQIITLLPNREQCFRTLCGTNEEATRLLSGYVVRYNLFEILKPVIVELLLGESGESFVSYLLMKERINLASKEEKSLPPKKWVTLASDLQHYHSQLASNGLWLGYYERKLRSYANDRELGSLYIDFSVSDAQIWPHPLILIDLARRLHIHLRLYQLNECGERMAHPLYPEHHPGGLARTVELLYLDDQRYTEIREIPDDAKVRKAGFKWSGDNGLISRCGMFKLSVPTLEGLVRVGKLEAIEVEEVRTDAMERIEVLEGQVKEHEGRLGAHEGVLQNHEQRISVQERRAGLQSWDNTESYRLKRLEDELKATRKELNTLNEDLISAKEERNDLIKDLQEATQIGVTAQGKVQSLENEIASLNTRIAQLEARWLPLNADRNPADPPPRDEANIAPPPPPPPHQEEQGEEPDSPRNAGFDGDDGNNDSPSIF